MASPLLLLFCFFLLSSAAAATFTDTLSQGESISGAAALVSSGEVFELGFFSPAAAAGGGNRRYVGIWYRDVEPQTVVWVANRDVPATSSSASVTVTASGDIAVLDGERVVWSTNTSAGASTAGGDNSGNFSAQLLDSGNLVLSRGGAGGGYGGAVWQSFEHPTDTMLSGMSISVRTRGGGGRMLFTSWRGQSDPAAGDYSLGLDPAGSGQAYIWKNGSTPIWRSGQWTGQNFVGIPWRPLYLYGFKPGNDPELGVYYTYTASNTSLQRFVVLPNGTDTCYMLNGTTREWRKVWMQPAYECEFYNTCGANAKCNRGEDGKGICSCLQGFMPTSTAEWTAGNWSRGCVRRTPLTCLKNESGDGFFMLPGIKLPDFSTWVSTVGDDPGCRQACLANCSCSAYTFILAVGCMTWGHDLVDIYQFDHGTYNLFVKVPASELKTESHHSHRTRKIVIIVASSFLFILVACSLLWWKCGTKIKGVLISHRKGKRPDSRDSSGVSGIPSIHFDDDVEDSKSHEMQLFALDLIKVATCDFSEKNKLGIGGFGPVYKGKLPGGQEVAVKRLSRSSGQGLVEFKNEVILIAKLQHRNLVRLLGCCIQGEEKILVYEYMPNKSLDSFLFDPAKQEQLDWKTRYNIIEGIIRGLLYLHRDSRLLVIHRDLKASNILLDTDMNPKISDFGMARIFGGDQNQVNTNRVVGTFGYMSPEYAMEGIFSVKSDIYSFGVLLLEIVTGQRCGRFHDKDGSLNIVGYAWRLWDEGNGEQLIDPSIRTSCPLREVMRCIHVALLCVQDHANDRPDISSVILMMSSDSSVLPSPKPPTLLLRRRLYDKQESREKDATYSGADVSMTLIHGR